MIFHIFVIKTDIGIDTPKEGGLHLKTFKGNEKFPIFKIFRDSMLLFDLDSILRT